MATKDACSYCHITFALAEKRVENELGVYHEDCDKARKRRTRLRDFIIRHALESGKLTITPHGLRR